MKSEIMMKESDEKKEQEKRPAEHAPEPAAQRPRREWLAAPTDRRQPRIGSDFQVSILPTPSISATINEAAEPPKEGARKTATDRDVKNGEVVQELDHLVGPIDT
jgi:hypothetical protein